MWNNAQIEVLREFLTLEVPKIINNYVYQPLNSKTIESISQTIQKTIQKSFDPRLKLRVLFIESSGELIIYLKDGEELYELIKGTFNGTEN